MLLRSPTCILLILFSIISPLLTQAAESTASVDSARTDMQTYRVSDTLEYVFEKPGKFDFIKNIPSSFAAHGKTYTQKKNYPVLGAILASTAFFVSVDPQFITNSRSLAKDLHIQDHGYSTNVSPIPKLDLYFPGDLGTSLYFIGDGFTDLTIDASFLTYGLVKNDNRALQTASQITEGLAVVGLYVQIMKHSFCRESPGRSSARGGVWRLFHNPKDTFTDVPKYDAMPSGHLASSMLTLTVIADNYPEYKFIRPLGYSLMSVLAFQMMNNGVHWMSDYPMGLFIGYDVAKHVTQKGRTIHVLSAPGTSRKQSFFERMDIAPAQFENDGYGVRSSFTF